VDQLFDIIHEDSDLLVVNKPADLVCHPTKGDVFSSLISRVRLHLGKNSQPHLVNRLDRETSGVVIVAKNPEAALELRRIWETRAARKEYLAIVHGHVAADRGIIDAPLGKDTSSRIAIKDCVRSDGAPSQTGFQLSAVSAERKVISPCYASIFSPVENIRSEFTSPILGIRSLGTKSTVKMKTFTWQWLNGVSPSSNESSYCCQITRFTPRK
jgi:hypothetical protein